MPRNRHPSDLLAAVPGQTSQYSTMPVPRCGFNRVRDLHRQFKWEFCNIVHGDFTPILAKHSKSFSLLDSISVGIDRMQRNFEPMRKQVETWRSSELTTVAAKMIIYEAFIESELEVPKHLSLIHI